MAKGKAAARSAEDQEQALADAITAAVAPFINVLPQERARRIVALQADVIARDETWTTYEGAPQPPEPIAEPALDSLSPDSAVAGDATDITMSAIGSGFTADSIIVFNGNPEPTTFVSETELTTGVKPSLFVVPAVCPVEINTGSQRTASVDFTFTDPVARSTSKRSKKDD